jgi:hypothetical protein
MVDQLVIPELGMLWQADWEFKASLGYIVSDTLFQRKKEKKREWDSSMVFSTLVLRILWVLIEGVYAISSIETGGYMK